MEKTCENCGNCEYIGDGVSVCMINMPPVIVMEEHIPSDDFLKCDGKDWEEQ